jgi:hypothetical protein
MFGPFGWFKHMEKAKAEDKPPCEIHYKSFTDVITCDAEATKQHEGKHYCDVHYELAVEVSQLAADAAGE